MTFGVKLILIVALLFATGCANTQSCVGLRDPVSTTRNMEDKPELFTPEQREVIEISEAVANSFGFEADSISNYQKFELGTVRTWKKRNLLLWTNHGWLGNETDVLLIETGTSKHSPEALQVREELRSRIVGRFGADRCFVWSRVVW